ncbi:MAG: ABC transporter permease [Candidatus Latescibacterota bacterium]|jgi:ABC-type Na+ efflux pump permease subunit
MRSIGLIAQWVVRSALVDTKVWALTGLSLIGALVCGTVATGEFRERRVEYDTLVADQRLASERARTGLQSFLSREAQEASVIPREQLAAFLSQSASRRAAFAAHLYAYEHELVFLGDPTATSLLVGGAGARFGHVARIAGRPGSSLAPWNDREVYTLSASGGPTVHGVLPMPDLAGFVGVVLSVMALLLSIGQIAEERENGVLRVVMAQPLSRSQLFVGKYLGVLAISVVSAVLTFAGYLLVPVADGILSLSADTVGRLAIMLLASLVYLSLFALAGLTLSARMSSGMATVAGLSFWFLANLAIPAMSGPATRWWEHPTTYEDLGAAKRREYSSARGSGTSPSEASVLLTRLEEAEVAQVGAWKVAARAAAGCSPLFSYRSVCEVVAGTQLDAYERAVQRLYEARRLICQSQAVPKAPPFPELQPFPPPGVFAANATGVTWDEVVVPVLALLLANGALFAYGLSALRARDLT